MKKTLIDMSIFLGIVPFAIVGILLLVGAGIFAWGAGFLAFTAGERVVKYKKEQRGVQVPVQPQQPSLDLVEMDVQMKFRDRSCDLRVVN